jgi:hypothetical protein
VIGKSLRERHGRGSLSEESARALLEEALVSHAKQVVELRAEDERMIACLVVHADEAAVRLCKELGFRMTPGGTGVFGLVGADAARRFAHLAKPQRDWLEVPCGARETKVLLISRGGTALLSLTTNEGAVTVTVVR